MAGHCKAEIVSAVKAAFDNKQLPDLENDAMAFMMSKSAYLYDEGDHNGPHLMFFTALKDGKDWGGFRIGLASCFRSLLVLIVEGTAPGERAVADSCVRSRSCRVVRWSGRTHASRHPTELRHGNQTASAAMGVHSRYHAIIHSHSCSSPTAPGSVLESTLARAVSRGRRSRPPDRRRGRNLA
jgi:hypothetical protein